MLFLLDGLFLIGIYLKDIWDSLVSIIRLMTVIDYLDILILTWLVYKIIKIVKETRAEQLIKGIVWIGIILFLLNQLGFKAMSVLSDTFFNVGIIAIIVMFQPELRRMLEKMGRTKMVKSIAFNLEGVSSEYVNSLAYSMNQVALACEKLSKSRTGALIVLERQTKLGEQIDTGTIIDSNITSELLCNIFFPNTPLHDGAVIIRENKLLAAGCFLPKPQKEELISKELGSRHRAAIGVSEISDAVVIIVSEETGILSVAENGEITRGFTKESLQMLLHEKLIQVYSDERLRKKPLWRKEHKQDGGKVE